MKKKEKTTLKKERVGKLSASTAIRDVNTDITTLTTGI